MYKGRGRRAESCGLRADMKRGETKTNKSHLLFPLMGTIGNGRTLVVVLYT
jgi:hypothetical protein